MKRSILNVVTSGPQRGATLTEVLVSVVVTAIGLLGVAMLQSRTYASESESYQRAHAAILLEDMASRIRANRSNAADYVSATVLGGGSMDTCATGATTPAAIATRDLCEWKNLLRGAGERDGTGATATNVGAMTNARACITQPDATQQEFVVTVTWEGTVESTEPASTCASDQYTNPKLRRALTTKVRIPTLA